MSLIMYTVREEDIVPVVSRLVIQANRYLPPDLIDVIKKAKSAETSETACFVLDILLENAGIAARTGLPVCQDTGIDVVFVEIGRDVLIDGDIEQAVTKGIAQGTGEGLLRASVCDPLTRKNSGDNTPPVVHIEHFSGQGLRLSLLPKGCGSENMSGIRMMPPSAGVEGIIDAVVAQVRSAGPNPCPPGIICVGIGGTMERAAYISKKALLRSAGKRHQRTDVASIEEEIERRLAETGIGPMGLGGRTTTLAVHAEVSPCHIASLPVAVNVQCHAARYAKAEFKDGKWNFNTFLNNEESANGQTSEMPFVPERLKLPLSRDKVSHLRSGQWVLLTGRLYTGRDQTHRRLVEMLDAGEELPVNLSDQLIYYVGPSPAPPGRAIGSAGPTTSYRMDAYTPRILEQGVCALIGKGKRSEGVRKALKEHKAVYFATIGGAGAYLSECIKKCSVAAFPELGPEALYCMEVEDFPAVVINDTQGNDLYGQERV